MDCPGVRCFLFLLYFMQKKSKVVEEYRQIMLQWD